MFFQRVKTPGIAHVAYMIGSNGAAAVVDPRRDHLVGRPGPDARADALAPPVLEPRHRGRQVGVEGDPRGGEVLVQDVMGGGRHGGGRRGPAVVRGVARGGVQERFRPGTIVDPPNEHRWHFWSLHNGGSYFLMADGSARFIPQTINLTIYQNLASRNDGNVVTLHD